MKIPFNKAKIDSLSLFIPISKVKIIDTTFTKKYFYCFEGTSEIEENDRFYKNMVYHNNKGIKTKISKIQRLFNGKPDEYIHLVLTSKMLKENYFHGINSTNIKTIYDYVMSLKIFECTIQVFLNSTFSDLDLCKDLKTESIVYKAQNNHLKNTVPINKRRYLRPFQNGNIQFNERKTGTPTNPFIKFYNKTDLLIKDGVFMNSYLTDYSKEIRIGIQRIEGTIKAYKHRKYLGIQNVKTLEDILKLNTNDLDNLHTKLIKGYFELKKMNTNKTITPQEKIIVHLMSHHIKNGMTKDEIYNLFIHEFEGVQKMRIKQKFNKLINYITNPEKLKINESDEVKKEIVSNLKLLGIYE